VVADFVSGRFANGRGFGILNIVDFNGSGGTSIRPASPCNRVGPMRRDVEPDRPKRAPGRGAGPGVLRVFDSK
jgi:hypothetical protein